MCLYMCMSTCVCMCYVCACLCVCLEPMCSKMLKCVSRTQQTLSFSRNKWIIQIPSPRHLLLAPIHEMCACVWVLSQTEKHPFSTTLTWVWNRIGQSHDLLVELITLSIYPCWLTDGFNAGFLSISISIGWFLSLQDKLVRALETRYSKSTA